MKVPLLLILPAVAIASGVLSCDTTEEEVSNPSSSATAALTSTTQPAQLSPTATVAPDLPAPADGYQWWMAPPASADAVGLRRYAVQIPSDWDQPPGPYLGTMESFVPPGATGGKSLNTPVVVPQLVVIVSPVTTTPPDSHPGWIHPFVWDVGQQGGGGCTGDVSAASVTPSSKYTTVKYVWDVFSFTCHVEHIGSPAGSTYDGRAGEVRVGDVIFAIVLFQPVGSDALLPVFQQAMESFTPQ